MSGSERPVRLLMIGRHFWPYGSVDSAAHLMDLATALKLAGLHVSVVTAKNSADAAEKFSFREMDVYRPVRMFRSGWAARGDRSASRYIRYLREWIETAPISSDAILCVGAREESIAAIEAARALSVPAIILVSGHGRRSDFEFFQNARIGKRCWSHLQQADAVVVSGAAGHRRWLAEGGRKDLVHQIPVGINAAIEEGASQRARLRRALARINGDLHIPDSCAVVLSTERMQQDSGIMTLVESAYSLSQKIACLQFWFVGDGAERETIYNRLKSDGLRPAIAMPGSFGLMSDVFVAADLMVQSGDDGFESHLPTAIAAGLPLVMANHRTAREFFRLSDSDVQPMIVDRRNKLIDWSDRQTQGAGNLVSWFDPDRPRTLRFAIENLVSDLNGARQRAQKLRQQLQQNIPRRDSIDRYLQLIRRLVSHRCDNLIVGSNLEDLE